MPHQDLSGLIGQRFGRLIIKRLVWKPEAGRNWFDCDCDCGGEKEIAPSALKQGRTRSCGCLRIEEAKRHISPQWKHGQARTSEYDSWIGMQHRCEDPKSNSYKNYGGRGIKVCRRWHKSNPRGVQNFLVDMGPKPYGHRVSIERKNNAGNYTPGNCRWATTKEQASNRRGNHLITFQGETHTLTQWAEKLGIPRHRLQKRLTNYGWSVERALSTLRKSSRWEE